MKRNNRQSSTSKKESLKIPRQVASRIPYTSIVKHEPMIEVASGIFMKTFLLDRKCLPDTGVLQDTGLLQDTGPLQDTGVSSMQNPASFLFSSLPIEGGFHYQLSSGYPPTEKTWYLSCSTHAQTIQEAKNRFDALLDQAPILQPLTTEEQLVLIHRFFHYHSSAQLTDKLDGQAFSPELLSKKKLTTKDLVGPDRLTFHRNQIETEGDHVRLLFLRFFTTEFPGISPLLQANNQEGILFSLHFTPVDPHPFLAVLESGSEKQPILPGTENEQVWDSCQSLLLSSAQERKPVFLVSCYFSVFAETFKKLEERTSALMAACSVPAFRVSVLEYRQEQALSSILPLANDCLSTGCLLPADSVKNLLSGSKVSNKEVLPVFSPEPLKYLLTGNTPVSRKKKRSQTKRTIQETLHYNAVHWEDGILESQPGTFSRMYSFSDINYRTASEKEQENLLIRYSQFLNRFDHSVRFQILLDNHRIRMDAFQKEYLLPPAGDSLDLYRDEYNALVLSKMEEGRNNLKKERYLVVSVTAPDITEARRTFARMDPEVINAFQEIGNSQIRILSLQERLQILYDLYHPEVGHTITEKRFSPYFPGLLSCCQPGISSKNLVSPDGFCFHRDWFQMGDTYCRVLYLMDLPNSLADQFVSELSAQNCTHVLSMNFETVRQDKAMKLVRHQLLNINSYIQKIQQTASKNGYSIGLIPQDTKQQQEDVSELLKNLTGNNEKMFLMTFTVLVFADSMEELQSSTETLVSTGRKYLCNLKKLQYQQEAGLNASLPYCDNQLAAKRTLTTSSTIIFTPFDTLEMAQPHGMYYGQNAISRSLIFYNRGSSQNGNGWILGTPGSGKSMATKREISMVYLNTQDDILVVDPEREYSPLAKAFGGSIVRIAPGSRYHLNPLDMNRDYGDDEDPVVLKSDFMISLFESVVGGRYGLSPIQISLIDRCVNLIYEEYVTKWNYGQEHTPTLLDYEKVLENQPEPEARELALAFETYTKGSLDVFAHASNVDITNRFVVYDIKDIGTNIKPMAYLIVLNEIWNRVVKNRKLGRKTWIYIDEVYLLLEKEESINFIRQIFSRCRKWGGKITAITQNVEPILQNPVITTMLSNSAFIQLMNQAPADRSILASLLHISPKELSYITDAPQGQGLLYIQGAGILPFRDYIDPKIAPNLYAVMTSKPEELMDEFR